jgi:DNA-directed RNA polymerase subunit RPC12/RpoP
MSIEEGFVGFACPSCGTEIEASPDMAGQDTECPACGARIKVPEDGPDGVVRHAPGDPSDAGETAIKSRTIRIELGDL